MKELMKILLSDILVENFSRKEMVVYGVVVPTAFVVVCLIVSIF